jgi:SEC-C motif-containing protein
LRALRPAKTLESHPMSLCPCGSGRDLDACCGPVLAGTPAATAEALMRSRYTAYVLGDIEHVSATLHPDYRHDHDAEAARRWARESEWEGLEIRAVDRGGAQDIEGTVEFVARYKEKGIRKRHHELAEFRRHEGAWYYVDGRLVAPPTARHDRPKVGRNEPCPCGSGKKYKKCCGA